MMHCFSDHWVILPPSPESLILYDSEILYCLAAAGSLGFSLPRLSSLESFLTPWENVSRT